MAFRVVFDLHPEASRRKCVAEGRRELQVAVAASDAQAAVLDLEDLLAQELVAVEPSGVGGELFGRRRPPELFRGKLCRLGLRRRLLGASFPGTTARTGGVAAAVRVTSR